MLKKVYELISKNISEKVLELKNCLWCFEIFPIFELQNKLENKIGISFKQYLCPSCTIRRLMMFRNETNIYKNNCNKCNKEIISIFSSQSKEIVYCFECYENADFIKKDNNIFEIKKIEEDFLKLYNEIPKKALINENSENSKYANYIGLSKNVYLSYLVYTDSEDIFYSYFVIKSKNCIDCTNIRECEKCYECINVVESFNCYYSYNLANCSNCYFSINLQNCKNCIFSSNLINKEYYIFNEQYSKEEYTKILNNLKNKMSSYEGLIQLKKDYENLERKTVYKSLQRINTENSVGNFLSNSKNAIKCSHSNGLEDCINVWGNIIKDSVNIIGGGDIQKSYNSCGISYNSQNIIGSFNVHSSSFVSNSMWIFYSDNVLFSVGLKNKSYCILNKTYSKEEYNNISKKIIGNLKEKEIFGDFFSLKLNKIPYNDSAAQEYFPVKKLIFPDSSEKILDKDGTGIVYILEPNKFLSKAILDLGGKEKINIIWKTFEKEINVPKGIDLIDAKDLPDKISYLTSEIENKILSSAIICKKTKRPFRIMKYELDFYKKNNLTIPKFHPKVRHLERMKKISSKKLYVIKCKKCNKEVISSFSENENKIIYCEKCYDSKVY